MSDTTNTNTGRNRETMNTDAMQWLSALVALIGLYLVASPFLFEATDAAYWNDTLVGTAIFLLAGYNFYLLSKDRLANVSIASLAALLGLWRSSHQRSSRWAATNLRPGPRSPGSSSPSSQRTMPTRTARPIRRITLVLALEDNV